MNFEKLLEILNTGKSFQKIMKELGNKDVDCIGNEVFDDDDLYKILKELGAEIEKFDKGVAIIKTSNGKKYKVPYEDRENRHGDDLPEETVLFFNSEQMQDITSYRWEVIINNNEESGIDIKKVMGTREQVVDYVKSITFNLAIEDEPMNISLGEDNSEQYYSTCLQYGGHHIMVVASKAYDEISPLPEKLSFTHIKDNACFDVEQIYETTEELGDSLYDDFFDEDVDEDTDFSTCGEKIIKMCEDGFIQLPSGHIIAC